MEYNWSIDKIRRQKRQTRDLLRKTEGLSKEEKNTLKIILQTLTEMENRLLPNKKTFAFPQKIKYMDDNHMVPVNTYLSYRDEIPSHIKQIVLEAIPFFANYTDTYDDLELPALHLSNQDLVAMSYDFYRWLPRKEYLTEFKKYTNPNKHLLRFIHSELYHNTGETFFFYYPTYRPYFCIDRNDTITDFITLNHEIAHGIMFRNDTTESQKIDYYFLTELEGFFFDFLSIQYLKQSFPYGIIQELEYTNFITAYNSFIDFYITDLTIRLLRKKKRISIIPIQKRILEQSLPFYCDETILFSALEQDPKPNTKYLISYLTSLDLEEIYETDPERAFYVFEQIRNNRSDNLFQNLNRNGISFVGEDDHYHPFQKKIEKMNQLGKNK